MSLKKDKKDLTPEKKLELKELMGSCPSPISWSLVSINQREEEQKMSNQTINEDHGYLVFSNLMDAVFDLANDLCEKRRLTVNEKKLLKAMDEYCAFEDDEESTK